jgi:transposase
MIPDDLEAQILRYFYAEKWKPGTIARQLGIHHETVTRVLRDNGVDRQHLPTRDSLSDPYVPFIIATLEKYPTLPASRLYAMVVERGYPGAPDHFRSVVRRYRPKPAAEAFLRLRTLPGEQAQVDWACFGHVENDGARRPLVAFVMVLSYSRRLFVQFGMEQRMGAFLRGHLAAFEAFGGVPRVLLYDNLKSAVTERVGDAIRFNETLLSFASHYRYEPRPVAVYRGNEKGRVERAIRYVRDSFFPARTWTDLEDLNTQAHAWCLGPASERRCPEDRSQTVRTVFEQEQSKLMPLPEQPFFVEDRVEVHAGKTPYIRFDLNDYSVPHDRVRRTLVVLATEQTVRVLDGNAVVATHARHWGKGAQIEDPTHIQPLVEQKREAREGRGMDRLHHAAPRTRAFLMAVAERGANLGSTTNGLLKLLDGYGADELERALGEVLSREAPHLAAVRQVLEQRRYQRRLPPALPVPLSDEVRSKDRAVKSHALSSYDQLSTPEGCDE